MTEFTDAHNLLVSMAENLLLLATQLREQKVAPQFSKLYDAVCEEIATLETRATEAGYSKTTINQSRFLLCALIDEIILSSDWGQASHWREKTLVNTFQKTPVSESHFFHILEQAEETPEDHIDLLELGYICLNLGYQGTYRDDQNTWTNLIDQLHDTIRHERGEITAKLLVDIEDKNREPKQWNLPPVWLTLSIGVILLLVIFIPYQKKLNNNVQPVLQTIQQISISGT